MNIIAGILIGITNNNWIIVLIASFVWGLVWLIYRSIRSQKLEQYLKNAKERNLSTKWDMSHTQSFYFIEYFTAVTTSLIFATLTYFIKFYFFIK